jgi:dTMP kinase
MYFVGMRAYPGFLISLEGGEGCGKTSQIPPLVDYLRSKGLTVFPTREPGGTSISEQIRDVLHDKTNTEMHPRTETLLYQAARSQIVEQVILPRLRKGEIVISDRYYDSTIAYQGYGHRQDIKSIRSLVKYATGGLIPDYTLLLNVDVEIGLSRKVNQGEINRMDLLALDFHVRVHDAYLRMVSEEPSRWSIVDANQPIEEVYKELRTKIENKLIFNGLLEGNRSGPDRRG